MENLVWAAMTFAFGMSWVLAFHWRARMKCYEATINTLMSDVGALAKDSLETVARAGGLGCSETAMDNGYVFTANAPKGFFVTLEIIWQNDPRKPRIVVHALDLNGQVHRDSFGFGEFGAAVALATKNIEEYKS